MGDIAKKALLAVDVRIEPGGHSVDRFPELSELVASLRFHASFEAALLFQQSLSDRVTVEAQFGDWSPIGGSTAGGTDYAGNVLFYGVGSSYEIVNTGRLTFAPVVELVGWRVLGGLQQTTGAPPQDAEGTNIVNLKLGGRANFDDRSSFYVGYGHALTDDVWYNNIIRFEYRYAF